MKSAATGLTLQRAENAILATLQSRLWARLRPENPSRVCVYRIGNIGDTVCALPAIAAIRHEWPDARLTLLTSPGKKGAPGARDVLNGADWIDDILTYWAEDIATSPGRRALLRRLREQNFDAWIELPAVDTSFFTQVRNIAMARAAGARWAAGWRVGPRRVDAHGQSSALIFPSETERLLEIVQNMGIRPRRIEFPLPITDDHRGRAAALIENAGFGGRRVAAIAPGAKREPNRWPRERFIEVGLHLARTGFAIAIIGGNSDQQVCAEVAAGIGKPAVNLAGTCTVLESCALLERCDFAVCNDSGVQHLAAAVGTRCISIFSCRDFAGIWSPFGCGHTVLRASIDCAPCLLEKCPFDNRCIKMIGAAEVARKCDEMAESRATDYRRGGFRSSDLAAAGR
jgi:ADP-heptose:LPS heptosyltransferase